MSDPQPVKPADLVPAAGLVPEEQFVEGDHPTHNPDGVANSNVDYWPKTQEEKAERMLVEMAEISNADIASNQPYPEGGRPDDRQAVLDQAHTKQEQVEEKNRIRQDVENLRAGGSLAGGAPVA
jgi:hypothetical protein